MESEPVDLKAHVKRWVVRRPGEDALEQAVGQIAERPLDRSRPLWEAWVVEGLSEGRIALVTKVHHAVLDGVSGAAMLLHLFDGPTAGADVGPPSETVPSPLDWVLNAGARGPERARKLAHAATVVGASLVRVARRRLEQGGDAGGITAPQTSLNRAISKGRSVAYARTSLEQVATIRAAFGGTVNDVVLAAVTAALRDYLIEGDELPDRSLVAAMPISTRDAADAPGGNRISAVTASLPVHIDEPLHRYWEVCRAANDAKRFHRVLGGDTLECAAECVSGSVLGAALRLYSGLGLADLHAPVHNVVISNVPGPPMKLSMGGAPVEAVNPHGPLMDGAGLNVTVMSYAGSIDVGVLACRATVPQVRFLAAAIAGAIEDLAKLAERELATREQEIELLQAVG